MFVTTAIFQIVLKLFDLSRDTYIFYLIYTDKHNFPQNYKKLHRCQNFYTYQLFMFFFTFEFLFQ